MHSINFVHMNDPQKFTKLKNNHHASYSFLRKVINPNNSFEINDINDNYNQVNRIINFKEPKFIEVSTYDRYYEIRGLRSQDFYINKESGG